MSDLGGICDDILGAGGTDDGGERPSEVETLAADVARFESWRAEKDAGLGLEPVEATDEEEFADAMLADPADDIGEPRDSGPGRRVPISALHEERSRRQQLQAEGAALQQQIAQLDAALQQLEAQALAAQQQRQQAAVPAFDEDPQTYIEHREKQFAEQLGQLQQQLQAQHHAQQLDVVQRFAAQAEAEVRAEVGEETYSGAVEHVMQYTAQALMQAAAERGVQLSPAELGHAMAVGLHEQVEGCRQRGLNPARQFMQRAKELGYQARRRSGESAEDVAGLLESLPWRG